MITRHAFWTTHYVAWFCSSFCIAAALLAAGSAQAATITFTLELDQAADYGSFTILPNATAANPSINTSDLGGTPNQVQVQTLITSPGFVNYSFMSSAVFDPSTSGPINFINWSTAIRRGTTGGQADTPLSPALMQNGTLYVYTGSVSGGDSSTAFRETSMSFSTVSLTNALATSFASYNLSQTPNGILPPSTNAGVHPDFTIGGSALTFGYVAASATGTTTLDRRTGIRNGSITVDYSATVALLQADPASGFLIDFGTLAPSTPELFDNVTLANIGDDGSEIDVTAALFGGPDSGLFSIFGGFSAATLDPAVVGSVDYDIQFAGSPTPGTYNATLTFQTSEGNVEYDLTATVEAAAVPEPSTWALGLLCLAGLGLRISNSGLIFKRRTMLFRKLIVMSTTI